VFLHPCWVQQIFSSPLRSPSSPTSTLPTRTQPSTSWSIRKLAKHGPGGYLNNVFVVLSITSCRSLLLTSFHRNFRYRSFYSFKTPNISSPVQRYHIQINHYLWIKSLFLRLFKTFYLS
jgi:hypothetical protein